MNDVPRTGAVPARLGFEYQDHVAANQILKMIEDRRVIQVECETADDICVVSEISSRIYKEYIQVKSTDRDSNWSLAELTYRNVRLKPTSIIEKSLLSDDGSGLALFRIVARRGLQKTLTSIEYSRSRRDNSKGVDTLGDKLRAKYPKTLSRGKRNLSDWARLVEWEVIPSVETIENRNLQNIMRISDQNGYNPSYRQAKTIYEGLLQLVKTAASADKHLDDKIVKRDLAKDWWYSELEKCRRVHLANAKPYRASRGKFFVQIHDVLHTSFMRRSSGYDVQYDRKVWRTKQLVEFLIDWLPELTLKASDLVEIDQLNLRLKIEQSLRQIKAHRSLDLRQLIAETMLHALLRQSCVSEPIACKLFFRSPVDERISKNAYFIRADEGDQIWIGRAKLYEGSDFTKFLDDLSVELTDAMATEVLVEEKEAIVVLRQPQHLRLDTFDEILERSAPIDDLIRVLCIPILYAYESSTLQTGHTDDYKAKLTQEVLSLASSFMHALPNAVATIQIHIFFVPVESVSNLIAEFTEALGLQ